MASTFVKSTPIRVVGAFEFLAFRTPRTGRSAGCTSRPLRSQVFFRCGARRRTEHAGYSWLLARWTRERTRFVSVVLGIIEDPHGRNNY